MALYTEHQFETETYETTAQWARDPDTMLKNVNLAMRDEVKQFAEAYIKLLQSRMNDDPAVLKDIWAETLDDVTTVLSKGHGIHHEQDVSAQAVGIAMECWEYGRLLKYAISPVLRLKDMQIESSRRQ